MDKYSTTSDGELLRHYTRDRCETAFMHLSQRYIGLVYSTCLRELHNPALAEDATQATFLLLAQKAAALTHYRSVAGWLFDAAQFTSRNLRRQEARRIFYEQKAAESMGQAQQCEGKSNELWETIEPSLNDALAKLKSDDREAVLLRFFEGSTLSEVGAQLGISENTARMRVSRALEKMRISLRRTGIALSVATLSALLTERAAQAAPPLLYQQITALGAATLAAGTTGTTITVSAKVLSAIKGSISLMAMTTVQKSIVVASAALLALLIGGVTLTVTHSGNNSGRNSGSIAKPHDPMIGKVAAPFLGKWQGNSENLNMGTGQWNKEQISPTFTATENGLRVDFGGDIPSEHYDFDPVHNSVTVISPQGRATYQVTGLRELAAQGKGSLVMTASAPSNGMAQSMRSTVTVDKDAMTLSRERQIGGQYQVVSRQTYRKSTP